MNGTKSVIVTGGASGIGRAVVQLLSARGWAVAVADRDEEMGVTLVNEVRASGGTAHFVQTDVADESSVRHMVDRALKDFGRIDGAINSAGVHQTGLSIKDMDAESWDRCNGINLRGMFLCIKYQVQAMWEQGFGSIVAVSSAAAVKGLPNSSDYCAAKAGITGLVRGAAIDCAGQNIRINALLPGATMTPLAVSSSALTPNLARTLKWPLNRVADPKEVASAAVWLVSDEATFVTGASIAVDGGMTIS